MCNRIWVVISLVTSGIRFTEERGEEGGLGFTSYRLPETNTAKRDFSSLSTLTTSLTPSWRPNDDTLKNAVKNRHKSSRRLYLKSIRGPNLVIGHHFTSCFFQRWQQTATQKETIEKYYFSNLVETAGSPVDAVCHWSILSGIILAW